LSALSQTALPADLPSLLPVSLVISGKVTPEHVHRHTATAAIFTFASLT